jgi:hypothetical protein
MATAASAQAPAERRAPGAALWTKTTVRPVMRPFVADPPGGVTTPPARAGLRPIRFSRAFRVCYASPAL